MGAVAVGALLSAALLVIVAALLWQGTRQRSNAEPAIYAVDEAAAFVHARLGDGVAARLDVSAVRRILEWGLYQAQVVMPRAGGPAPVFGSGEAITAILEEAEAAGFDYDPLDVGAVLAAEGEYLVEIGAVGDPVAEPPA